MSSARSLNSLLHIYVISLDVSRNFNIDIFEKEKEKKDLNSRVQKVIFSLFPFMGIGIGCMVGSILGRIVSQIICDLSIFESCEERLIISHSVIGGIFCFNLAVVFNKILTVFNNIERGLNSPITNIRNNYIGLVNEYKKRIPS